MLAPLCLYLHSDKGKKVVGEKDRVILTCALSAPRWPLAEFPQPCKHAAAPNLALATAAFRHLPVTQALAWCAQSNLQTPLGAATLGETPGRWPSLREPDSNAQEQEPA